MILENTNLVKQHFNPKHYRAYRDFDNIVQIINGRLPQPESGSSCAARLAFPRALFYVSRRMSDDVCEVFFSRNRFVLKGNMSASRHFLENLPASAARRIRQLDLELSFDDVAKMGDQLHTIPYAERRECTWHGLIRTIRERLDLSKLWLSIDAGKFRTDLFDDGGTGHIFEFDGYGFLNEAWYQIFAPLRQLRNPVSGGLKKLHVFLAWDSKYETLAEKEIMGPSYNSAGEGKLPRLLRDYNEPHRVLQEQHHQYRHDEIHVTPRGFDLLFPRSGISLAEGDGAEAWFREGQQNEVDWFRDSGSWTWYRDPVSWDRWLRVIYDEGFNENGSLLDWGEEEMDGILINWEDFDEMTVWDPETMCRRQKHGSEMSKVQTERQAINLLRDEVDRERATDAQGS